MFSISPFFNIFINNMKSILLNFLFLFCTIGVFCQIENIPKSSLLEKQMFSENFEPVKTTSAKTLNENRVLIQQVGEGNNIDATIRSQSSNVSYNQNGDFNYIGIKVNVEDYTSTINQQGNNNNIFDQIYNTNAAASIELNQTGNNLHFERFGSNDIGDNLQFNMMGESRTIVVRNFN